MKKVSSKKSILILVVAIVIVIMCILIFNAQKNKNTNPSGDNYIGDEYLDFEEESGDEWLETVNADIELSEKEVIGENIKVTVRLDNDENIYRVMLCPLYDGIDEIGEEIEATKKDDGVYEAEINFEELNAEDGYYQFKAILKDYNGNEKEIISEDTINYSKTGISYAFAYRKEDGRTAVQITALGKGEVLVSTTNVAPTADDDRWTKYESGEEYIIATPEENVENVYVWYKDGEKIANTANSGYNVMAATSNYKNNANQNFTTLAEAFASTASVGTITVLQNVTDNVHAIVPDNKTLILDLNGKTITSNCTSTEFIINKGNLTLRDSGGEGKLILTGRGYVINNSNILIVESGTYISEHASAIDNSGTLTIKDGHIEGGTHGIYAIAGEVYVNGGTIAAGKYNNNSYVHRGIYAAGTSNVTVSNGTITSPNDAIGFPDTSSGNLVVSGGNIFNKYDDEFANMGGTSAGSNYHTGDAIEFGSTGSCTITGGTIKSEIQNGVFFRGQGDQDLIISGGNISAPFFAVSCTPYDERYGVDWVEPKKVQRGNVVIQGNATITTTGVSQDEYNNTRYSKDTHKDRVYAGVYINTEGTVTIGTQSGGVNITAPSIQGETYGIISTNGFKFYDGILKGKEGAFSGTVTEVETDYGIHYDTEGDYKTAYLVAANYKDNASPENTYDTLANAFNKVATGKTIAVIGENVQESTRATLTDNKSIILDLNGKTITYTSEFIGVVDATLEVKDSKDDGEINNTTNYFSGLYYHSNGNIIISGGTIKGLRGISRQDYGAVGASVTMTGGQINATSICIDVTTEDTVVVTGGKLISSTNVGINYTQDESGRLVGSLTIGTKDGATNTQTPMIQGATYGVDAANGFEFYDGILKGKEGAFTGTVTEVETDYGIHYDTEGDYKTAYLVAANYEDNASPKNTYTTLADAFSKTASGRTITVLKNVEENDPVEANVISGKTLTLDLSGKTITINKKYSANTYIINNNGNLTLKGNGTINAFLESQKNTNEYLHGRLIINNGNLTVESGNYNLNSSTLAHVTFIYQVGENSITNINGGNIVSNKTSNYNYAYGIQIQKGTLNVRGGSIEANGNEGSTWICGIIAEGEDSQSHINVNGGNITADYGICLWKSIETSNLYEDSVNISGNAKINGRMYGIYNNRSIGGITIDAGTITGGKAGIYQNVNNNITTSGTVSGQNGISISAGSLTVNNGTITGTTSAAITAGGGASITVNSGIIKSSETDSSAAIMTGEKSSVLVNINGGTITGEEDGIQHGSNNPITISGGTITGNSFAGVNNGGTGTLTITNGTISGNTYGIIMRENVSATRSVLVKGGTIKGTGNSSVGLYVESPNVTVEIGASGGGVSITNPTIQGEGNGIDKLNTITIANFKFYDGIIKGRNNSMTITPTVIESGYGIHHDTDGDYKTAYLVIPNYEDNAVPKNVYSTLDDAFTKAPNGGIITVIGENVQENTYTKLNSKNIILDLNGKTITYSGNRESNSYIVILQGGNIEVKDTKGNGKINNTTNYYSALYYHQGGKITVSGGTLTARRGITREKEGATGTVIMTGGEIITTEGCIEFDTGTYITITGGKLTSSYGSAIKQVSTGKTDSTVTIGTPKSQDGKVDIQVPMLQGAEYAINTINEFEFYDGILKGKTDAFTGTNTGSEPGYIMAYGSETINGQLYKTAYLIQEILGNSIITEWTVPANATIKLPIPANSNNTYQINWGDGKTEVALNSVNFVEHRYNNSASQKYTVTVTGTVDSFGYFGEIAPTTSNIYKDYYTFTQYVTALKNWGEVGATRYGFSQCVNLAGAIPTPSENTFKNVTNISYLFYNCGKLNETIPATLFKNSLVIKNAIRTFKGCSGLTGGEININTNNITSMDEMFYGCKNMNTIVFGTEFRQLVGKDMFTGCNNLESVVMLYEYKG